MTIRNVCFPFYLGKRTLFITLLLKLDCLPLDDKNIHFNTNNKDLNAVKMWVNLCEKMPHSGVTLQDTKLRQHHLCYASSGPIKS